METLKHGMNCPGLIPLGDDCTCGLEWRIQLQTKQTMHVRLLKRIDVEKMAKVMAGGQRVWEMLFKVTKEGYIRDATALRDYLLKEE